MSRQLGTGRFAALAAAVLIAAGLGLAADQAFAAKVKTNGDHKVKAQIKHGTLVVEGTPDDDQIVLRLRSGDPTRVEVVTQDGVVGHNLRRDRFDQIFVDAGAGNDRVAVDESNGVFTDTETTTVDGGPGNDALLGGSGNETFDGGPGNDSVDGNGGADAAFLGAGDDSFTWDPGDGSDVVEGEDGFDEMVFNGSAGGEIFAASNNNGRLRFTRNLGNIVMDVDGTEQVDLNTLGGADATTVNDLSATDVVEVGVDLAAAIGGNTGDGAADTVTVNGTNNADTVQIAGANGGAAAGGLAAVTRIGNAEANDTLVVNGLGGDDALSATNLAASAISLAMNGGSENDTLLGGAGIDKLSGDSGNDVIDGNGGNDTGLLGTGDDSFIWDPGDGSDVVEGGAGFDTMVFNGAAGNETFDASANGGRLKFFRQPGNILMDTDDTERVDLRALGGVDATTVNDLSATDVVDFAVDLAAAIGGNAGDGAADTVTVNGTNGDDVAAIAGANGSAFVAGLSPFVRIAHAEAVSDRLLVSGLGGNDAITAGPLAASAILLTLEGGTGNDLLRGGSGNDVLSGGPGVDFLDGGAGADQINCGGAGDTIVPDPLDVIAADCS
jgi:Ca2+-binding RTX toxin-like protein